MQLQHLRLDQLNFSSHPVRLSRSAAKMEELRQSIESTEGPLDPLLVRDLGGGEYIVVAGESRLQALLDLNYPLDHEVPCLVGQFDDQQALAYGLIENMVRQSLTPYEKALAVYRLVHTYHYKKVDLGRKIGKNRGYINSLLQVFGLIESVQTALNEGDISLGHAQALYHLKDEPELQAQALQMIIQQGLSVKAARTKVKELLGQNEDWFIDPGTVWLSENARLEIQAGREGMNINARVTNPDELQQVIDQLEERRKDIND